MIKGELINLGEMRFPMTAEEKQKFSEALKRSTENRVKHCYYDHLKNGKWDNDSMSLREEPA